MISALRRRAHREAAPACPPTTGPSVRRRARRAGGHAEADGTCCRKAERGPMAGARLVARSTGWKASRIRQMAVPRAGACKRAPPAAERSRRDAGARCTGSRWLALRAATAPNALLRREHRPRGDGTAASALDIDSAGVSSAPAARARVRVLADCERRNAPPCSTPAPHSGSGRGDAGVRLLRGGCSGAAAARNREARGHGWSPTAPAICRCASPRRHAGPSRAGAGQLRTADRYLEPPSYPP